jgi:hypothetical protein
VDCTDCNRRKGSAHNMKPPLNPLPVVEAAFDRVSVDLLGPLPITADGYRCVAVFIDALTRWTILVPLRRMTAEETAKAFVEKVVCVHSCPRSTNFE